MAINLTNGIYYTIIVSHLIHITFNTPVLDDCSAAKKEEDINEYISMVEDFMKFMQENYTRI